MSNNGVWQEIFNFRFFPRHRRYIIAGIAVTGNKLSPVTDFHRFYDTGDKCIAGNNDTGDN
jgi:hypothetical protein